jgi:regulator of protease activity HflC (stomatin/prohibitin superfamily)
MTYVVVEGQEAIVLRSDHPVRLEEPGIHFKIPFLEEIEIYPVGKVFSYKVKGIRVISRKKERMYINASLDWKVCNTLTAYKYFNYFEESRIAGRIYLILDEILKRTATKPDIANIDSLVQDYEITLKIENVMQKRLDVYGICIYNLKLHSTNEQ